MNGLIAAAGYVLDLIFSEPRRIPHPVVMIGNLISRVEQVLYREEDPEGQKILKGALLNFSVLGTVFAIVTGIVTLALAVHPLLYLGVSAVLVSFTVSTTALKDAAMEVHRHLLAGDLPEARKQVGMIVGRDTSHLDEGEISRAVIETVSENIVDGVTSPLFFALLGGAPLAFLYRAANTLDSMVGYKNERYLYFGRFSARLDDVLNYIPARLTAILIILFAFFHPALDGRGALRSMLADADKHPSPNGGYTESATAGALGIRLGGYNSYFGKQSFRAYMGEPREPLSREKISGAVKILYGSTFLWVTIMLLILLILY